MPNRSANRNQRYRHHFDNNSERNPVMFDQQYGHQIAFERAREMEWRSRHPVIDRPVARPGPIRIAVGRAFIRIGFAIAHDGRMQPASR